MVLGPDVLGPAGALHKRFARLRERFDTAAMAEGRGRILPGSTGDRFTLGVTPAGQCLHVLIRVFDESEFLPSFRAGRSRGTASSTPSRSRWTGTP